MTSLSASRLLRYHRPGPTAQRFTQDGLRAWDLTPSARSAFHFLTLFPTIADGQEPNADVPIVEWLCDLSITQIHTPACLPLAGAAVFQVVRHPIYPHVPLVAERLLWIEHQQPSDWWLHSAAKPRTSTTFPLPIRLIRATAKRGYRVASVLLDRLPTCPHPLREHEQALIVSCNLSRGDRLDL